MISRERTDLTTTQLHPTKRQRCSESTFLEKVVDNQNIEVIKSIISRVKASGKNEASPDEEAKDENSREKIEQVEADARGPPEKRVMTYFNLTG